MVNFGRTYYNFTQSIIIKAKTKTEVFIKTRRIEGTEKFHAYYELKARIIASESSYH